MTWGGVVIGTFSGGNGNQALVVNLYPNATPGSVQALARVISFETIGDNPNPLPRTITFLLSDGDGAVSNLATKIVNVTALNDAPILTGSATPLGYTRGNAAKLISNTFAMIDADSTDFNSGRLLVKLDSGGESANRLEVGGAFSFDGTIVNYFNGVSNIAIGSRNADGGVGIKNLAITFNVRATQSIVQSLLRNIRFRTEGVATTNQRVVSFNLTDGDGGVSNTVTRTVNIQ